MAKTNEKRKNQSNVKNKTKLQGIANNKHLELFRWILLSLLAIVVFYPPYLRGLYFETEQLPAEVFVFIIYIVFLVYKFLKQDKKFIKTPLEYVSLGFVLVYFISIFGAVGTREAIGEWLKYCMFFAVFIMLSELLKTDRAKLFVLWTIVASALGISIIGIDGVAGSKLTGMLNGFFKALGAGKDVFFGIFVGNRINSTFQYPNATAAYLIAVFFVAVALMMLSKKIYIKLVAGISSYIFLITFMLTLSRGAVIFLPIAGVFFIIMQPVGYRIRSILNMIPSIVGMLLTVTKLSNYMASPDGNAANIWKYFIVGILITAVIQTIIEISDRAISKVCADNENIKKKLRIVGYVLCGFAVVLIIAGSLIVVTTKSSLVLAHGGGQADSSISVRRSFTLEPDKEYKLVYAVQSENNKDKPNTYSIAIASRDFAGIINGKDTAVTNIEGKATNGLEQKEVQFKVPSNSKTVSITFGNYYEGTKAEFKDAKIVPLGDYGKEQKIALKYKFIPESIYARIDETKETKSGVERTIFARNGFEIFKDHPVLGGGGGSWPLQYFAHQSYLYWTTQAHNYPVQVAVETGTLGLIVLVGLWTAVGFQIIGIIRRRKTMEAGTGIINAGVLAGALALIMHSVMDFDLSLSSIYLLLWELLAVLNSNILVHEKKDEDKLTNSKLDKLIHEIKSVSIHPGITIILALIVIIFPIMFVSGANNNEMAIKSQNSNDVSGAIKYMDKAVSADPFSAKYKVDYINLVIRQDPKTITQSDIIKSNKYAGSIEKSAEHNVDVAAKLGAYYLSTGNIKKGIHFFERATELRPLNAAEWQQKADAYYQLAMYFKSKSDEKSAEKYFNEVLNISSEVKKVSQSSMIPFTMTPTTMEIIEKVRLLEDKQNTLNQAISSKSIFYSINDIDTDGNGIPDEWNDTNTNDLKLQVSDNKLTAEAQAGKQGVLQSRKINLKPGKTYVISIDLENANDIKGDVMVTLSGQKDPIKLIRGATYEAEFTTGTGGNIEPVSLGLIVNGKYVLRDARVVEK